MTKNKYATLIVLLVGLYFLSFAYRFDDLTMTPFRESQTAITIYYLIENINLTSIVNYKTPVLGYPWQMPMEFPLYQVIVALLSWDKQVFSVIAVGKSISLTFFIGAVYFIFKLLKCLAVENNKAILICGFIISSPVYLAYSSTVMIESAALMFGVLHLICLFKGIKLNSIKYLIFGLIFSIITILIKSTTWVVFSIIVINSTIFYLYKIKIGKLNFENWLIVRNLIILTCFTVVPLIVGLNWINFTDDIKSSIFLSEGLSSNRLKEWNYGSLQQRLSASFWFVILLKLFFLVGGSLIFYKILFYKDLYLKFKNINRREFIYVPVSSVVVIIMLFPNLYFRHDYYFYSISWIVSISIAWLLIDKKLPNKLLILYIVLIQVGAGFYLILKKNYYVPSDIVAINLIGKNELKGPIIIFDKGYSSYIPFMTQSRALMLGEVDNYSADKSYFRENKNIKWEAVLYKSNSLLNAEAIKNKFELDFKYKLNYYEDYWIETNKIIDLPSAILDQKLTQHLANYQKIKDYKKNDGFIRYINISFVRKNKFSPSFELILGRSDAIFYIDLFAPIFVKI